MHLQPSHLALALISWGSCAHRRFYYSARSQKGRVGLAGRPRSTRRRTRWCRANEMQRSRLSTAQLKSTQRASMAGQRRGSVAGQRRAGAHQHRHPGEIDAQTIDNNALLNAWGYRSDARMSARQCQRDQPGHVGGDFAAGQRYQVASSWYAMSKTGAFDTTTGQADPRAGVRGQRVIDVPRVIGVNERGFRVGEYHHNAETHERRGRQAPGPSRAGLGVSTLAATFEIAKSTVRGYCAGHERCQPRRTGR